MTSSLKHISAMSLFVEDLQAAKTFYQEVFGVTVIFEDESSVAVRFERKQGCYSANALLG